MIKEAHLRAAIALAQDADYIEDYKDGRKRKRTNSWWEHYEIPPGDARSRVKTYADEILNLGLLGEQADALVAPPPPTHPKPRGPVPKHEGAPCTWDGDVGCWRTRDGAELVMLDREAQSRAFFAAQAEQRAIKRARVHGAFLFSDADREAAWVKARQPKKKTELDLYMQSNEKHLDHSKRLGHHPFGFKHPSHRIVYGEQYTERGHMTSMTHRKIVEWVGWQEDTDATSATVREELRVVYETMGEFLPKKFKPEVATIAPDMKRVLAVEGSSSETAHLSLCMPLPDRWTEQSAWFNGNLQGALACQERRRSVGAPLIEPAPGTDDWIRLVIERRRRCEPPAWQCSARCTTDWCKCDAVAFGVNRAVEAAAEAAKAEAAAAAAAAAQKAAMEAEHFRLMRERWGDAIGRWLERARVTILQAKAAKEAAMIERQQAELLAICWRRRGLRLWLARSRVRLAKSQLLSIDATMILHKRRQMRDGSFDKYFWERYEGMKYQKAKVAARLMHMRESLVIGTRAKFEANSSGLRFKVGDHVLCRYGCGNGWMKDKVPGTIVELWVLDPDDWSGRVELIPGYRVDIGDGKHLVVPEDEERFIQLDPSWPAREKRVSQAPRGGECTCRLPTAAEVRQARGGGAGALRALMLRDVWRSVVHGNDLELPEFKSNPTRARQMCAQFGGYLGYVPPAEIKRI